MAIETVDLTTPTTATTTESNSQLGKEDFLILMIEQLKYQDPLDPLDGADYTAQLAQFSSLEQLQNMSDSLDQSVLANLQLSESVNNMMSATLIGKEVKISSNTIEYNRQESAEIGYTLPSEANEITLKIYDEDGKLVRTVEDLEKSEGEHNYTWDFTDDDGDQVDDDSSFTYKIEATSSNDEDITVEQYQIGTIDAIRFTENGTAVVVNNTEYYLSDISEILTKTEIEDETS